MHTIAISVVDDFGDLLGSCLIAALRRACPNVRVLGIGGARMRAQGFENLYSENLSAAGGLALRKKWICDLRALRPDVFVGIDAPDFNLAVAGKLKQAGIAAIHYVSPSVGAWSKGLMQKIVTQTDKVLCLFPSETRFYLTAGGQAEFVGHPLVQRLPVDNPQATARQQMRIEPWRTVFCLMPGSCVSEINHMAALFLQTAELLLARYPSAQFVLPVTTADVRARLQAILSSRPFSSLPVRLINGHSDLACLTADVVLATGTTATLETLLCKRPMVVSHSFMPSPAAIGPSPYLALPNILLDKNAVPEFTPQTGSPAQLAQAVADWYESPRDTAVLQQELRQLHLTLNQDADKRAADVVLALAQRV